jgi:hypothetical protein
MPVDAMGIARLLDSQQPGKTHGIYLSRIGNAYPENELRNLRVACGR